MTLSMNEQSRIDRNSMSAAQFDQLVKDCLGEIALLGIVGSSDTGKSWAAREWVRSCRDELELAAYVDCRRLGLSVRFSHGTGGGIRILRGDVYPQKVLDGVDIVVVDEPERCLPFVQMLATLASPSAGMAAHRLVVLLLHDVRLLRAFASHKDWRRCVDTSGVRIPATASWNVSR